MRGGHPRKFDRTVKPCFMGTLFADTSLTTTVFFVHGESPYISLHSTQLVQTPVNADNGPR